MSADGYRILAKPYRPKQLLDAVQAEFIRRPLPTESECPEDTPTEEPETKKMRDAG